MKQTQFTPAVLEAETDDDEEKVCLLAPSSIRVVNLMVSMYTKAIFVLRKVVEKALKKLNKVHICIPNTTYPHFPSKKFKHRNVSLGFSRIQKFIFNLRLHLLTFRKLHENDLESPNCRKMALKCDFFVCRAFPCTCQR